MAEIVLVTGANRGIGLAVTQVFLKEGDKVFAACRDPRKAERLNAWKKDYPSQLEIIPLDVDSEDSVKSASKEVAGKASQLDVLVNMAAILPRPHDAKLEEFNLAQMREAFETNTIGPLRVSRAFLPLLRKAKNPRVVNVSSGAGSISGKNYDGFYAYGTSKAALNMVTRTFASEFKKERIVCVALDPGWVKTDMGGADAQLTPEESSTAIVKTVKGLSLGQTSQFIYNDGKVLNW